MNLGKKIAAAFAGVSALAGLGACGPIQSNLTCVVSEGDGVIDLTTQKGVVHSSGGFVKETRSGESLYEIYTGPAEGLEVTVNDQKKSCEGFEPKTGDEVIFRHPGFNAS